MSIETGTGPSAVTSDRHRPRSAAACGGTLRRIFAAAAGRADILPASVAPDDDGAVHVSPAVWPSSPVAAALH
ncbi:MAG TPA: hypothetical protein PKA74_00655 [Bauldia sp.]|nr:hypothetical protein [Bauldia sp.]